jgi:hypothetical protein
LLPRRRGLLVGRRCPVAGPPAVPADLPGDHRRITADLGRVCLNSRPSARLREIPSRSSKVNILRTAGSWILFPPKTKIKCFDRLNSGINALSAEALAEIGVGISSETPKPIDPDLLRTVDVVVTRGRDARVDVSDGVAFQNWDTDEASERGIDGVDRMRLSSATTSTTESLAPGEDLTSRHR